MTFKQAIQTQIDTERTRSLEHGWTFKERTADNHTIGDFISAVMHINNPDDARQFYHGLIEFLEIQRDRTHPAKYVADSNIGWCFGEGMSDERIAMWRSVTDAAHPVFGYDKPTVRQAIAAGKERAACTTQK